MNLHRIKKRGAHNGDAVVVGGGFKSNKLASGSGHHFLHEVVYFAISVC